MKNETLAKLLLKGSDPICKTPDVINDLYHMILNLQERVEDLEVRLNEFEEGDE